MTHRGAAVNAESTAFRRALARAAALLGATILLATGFGAAPPVQAAEYSKLAGGYQVYLGVLPAGVLFLYRPDHGDATMHGGPRVGDAHHVLVGLVDAASGARIADAEITARITPAKGGPLEKRLEAMAVDRSVAYGGFFPLRRDVRYRIDLTIRRPGTAVPVETSFDYTHRL